MKTSFPILFLSLFLVSISVSSSASTSSFNILDQAPEDFIRCLKIYSNNATSIAQSVYTPKNSSFQSIWQFSVNNVRFNTPSSVRPLVIVTPVDESQVRTVLFCARKRGLEIRIRCGGHDFEGLSYTNPTPLPFVMVDMINMRAIEVDVNSKTAWVQGGASLGELYYTITNKKGTLGFPGGTWSTVGVGGLISGGGYGFLMRKYGLAVDHVLDARFMDVNGRILNRKLMGEDLFWAIRGGGASSFGVILAWKLRLVDVPERITLFFVTKTLEQNATSLLYKWQFVAPNMNKDFQIRAQLQSKYIEGSSGKKTIQVMFEGFYLGTIKTLLPIMATEFPELGVTRDDCSEMSYAQSALTFSTFTKDHTPEILLNRSAMPKLGVEGKSDFVRTPIPIKGIEGMWDMFMKNDMSENFVLNPYGGRMDEISESATPFPHRKGTLYMILEWVSLDGNPAPAVVARRMKWIRDLYRYLAPYVSKSPRRAYLNYNDFDVGVGGNSFKEANSWGERYFNKNFKRLVQVKTKVDPTNFFRHPQSIPPFGNSIEDM